jgi:low temperature requirement protein LtrA
LALRTDLIKPPQFNNPEEDDPERHANWTELLFDLVFVAAISLLSLNLSKDYSLMGLLESLPLFFVIWWAWVGHTFYMTRFGTDDLVNRFLTMVQMLIVASLAVYVRDALGSTGTGFALSYAALRFILVFEYYLVSKQTPQFKPLSDHYAMGYGVAALLWAISAFIPTPWRFVIWGVAIVIDLLTPLSASDKHLKFPPHATHLPERFGLFTIILIGEAIISVVFTISSIGLSLGTEIAGVMGLLIAFSIWWAYFEEAGGAEARVLEAGTQIRRYQLWLYSHFPLLIGITMVADGIKHVIALTLWQPMIASEVWMLCSGLALTLLSLSTIFFSAYRLEECKNREIHRFRLPYYVIIVLVLLTGFLGSSVPGELILGILTILCLFKVALSFRRVTYQSCDLE